MTRRLPTALAIAASCLALLPASAFAFEPLSSFGAFGEGAGQFKGASGLAVGSDGTIFLSEFRHNRVSVFSSQGAFLYAFGRGVNLADGSNLCNSMSGCGPGSSGGSAGNLSSPAGLAIGPEGSLFVAESGNERIDVFSTGGEFLRAYGKEVDPNPAAPNRELCTTSSGCQRGAESGAAGGLRGPEGLGFDPAGDLFVADSANNRIDVFSAGGDFIRAFGLEVNLDPSGDPNVCTATSGCRAGRGLAAPGALSTPLDVGSAPNGLIAVSGVNHRIDVFTSGGEFIRAFGKGVNPDPAAANRNVCTAASGCSNGVESAEAGAFLSTSGLAIDSSNQVYVADPRANRVDQFSLEGSFIRAFGAGVTDGSEVFQVCTLLCRQGTVTRPPSGITFPEPLALDCAGALYTTSEWGNAAETEFLNQIVRLGEPGIPPPPCLGATPPAKPSNRFKLLKLVLNKKRGTARLIVQVFAPGRLLLKAKGAKTAKRIAKVAGRVKLPLTPTGKAKRKLAKTGALKLRAKITFSPTGGDAASKTKVLRLKKLIR